MILLSEINSDEWVARKSEIELFGREIVLSDIKGYSTTNRFGVLYGLDVRTFSGKPIRFTFVGIGMRRQKVEREIDEAIEKLIRKCREYWTAKIQQDLFNTGAFHHEGLTLKKTGEVSSGSKLIRIAAGHLTHEVHGEKVVLQHTLKAKKETLEWSPGIAMTPILDQIYYIRGQLLKLRVLKEDGSPNRLKLRSTERMLDVLAHLAAVIVSPKKPTDFQRLSLYLSGKGARLPTDGFLKVAPNFIRSKGYLQKAFESLQRYHEKNGQQLKAREAFYELAELAMDRGEYSPRQLFALYEIGLFLGFSLPRITAVLSAIKDKQDPNDVAEPNPGFGSGYTNSSGGTQAEPHIVGARCDNHPAGGAARAAIRFPSALAPMLAILNVVEVYDGEDLKQAWKTAVKQAHPDTLGLGASEAEREAATLATKDINMAYDLLKAFV
jgi:hypothetical protein